MAQICSLHPPPGGADDAQNSIDINLMVSVTAIRIGTETLPGEGVWARTAANIAANNGLGGDSAACDLLYGVLEATASLAVSEAKLQVIAVALHMGPRWGGEATLTFADNCDVADGVSYNMKVLWRTLYSLAHGPPTSLVNLKTSFIQGAYCYSVSKNLKRYDKWMPRLQVFAGALTVGGNTVDRFRAIVNSLVETHELLKTIEERRRVDDIKPFMSRRIRQIIQSAKDNWAGLILSMDGIRNEWGVVAETFQNWAINLQWETGLQEINETARPHVRRWFEGIACIISTVLLQVLY